MARELLTVGHSTHPINEFVALLEGAGVEEIVDVRRYPASRRNPQFNAAALAESVAAAGIRYEHLGELGGRRRVQPDSPNDAWTVSAFRGYADYLRTPEFAAGRRRLAETASERRTAIMCAEAAPWRCHRRLIADVFVFDGWRVLDLLPSGELREHVPPPFARRGADGLPIYSSAPARLVK